MHRSLINFFSPGGPWLQPSQLSLLNPPLPVDLSIVAELSILPSPRSSPTVVTPGQEHGWQVLVR